MASSIGLPVRFVRHWPVSRKTPGVRRAKAEQVPVTTEPEIQAAPKCPLHVGATMVLHEAHGLVPDLRSTDGQGLTPGKMRWWKCPVTGCYRVNSFHSATPVERPHSCADCGKYITYFHRGYCRECKAIRHKASDAKRKDKRHGK